MTRSPGKAYGQPAGAFGRAWAVGGRAIVGAEWLCLCKSDGTDGSECNQQSRTWLTMSGTGTHQAGNDNSAATANTAYAVQTGIEHRFQQNTLYGFAVDMTNSSFSVPDRWTAGSIEGVTTSAYGMGWGDQGLYGKSLVSLGAYNNKTGRKALDRQVNGEFQSYTLGSTFEAGARIGTQSLGVMPYAGLAVDMLFQPAWAEDNSLYGNQFHDQLTSSTRLSVGVSFDADVALSETMQLRLMANAMHELELSQQRGASVNSLAAPGFDWKTEGLAAPSGTVKLDGGLTLKPSSFVTLSVKGSHTFYEGGTSSAATVSVSGSF